MIMTSAASLSKGTFCPARLACVDFDGGAALLDAQDPAKDILAHAQKMLGGIEDLLDWLLY